MILSPLGRAIEFLGGQTAARSVCKRSQATISNYIKDGNPPADVCMRIEVATSGRFRAEDLRPDLADVFRDYRKLGRAA